MSSTNSRELEVALAVLAVNYKKIEPTAALDMIRQARSGRGQLLASIKQNIPETELLQVIANELGVEYLDMHSSTVNYTTDEKLISNADSAVLQKLLMIPLRTPDGQLLVAMANPLDMDAANYARKTFEESFRVVLSPRAQIYSRILQVADDFTSASGSPVPEWIDHIFRRAVADGASDVHFRMLLSGRLLVRFRVDGVLRNVPYPESLLGKENEACAAMLAKCPTTDSSNMRDTQDGTFSFTAAERTVDVRLALLPTITGPNITCRLLDPQNLNRKLEDMGFDATRLVQIRQAAAAPQGALLVVGPTGSGKSTTLYSLLGELDPSEKNIITLEDPVEYRMHGIAQVPIRSHGDKPLTFARALRNVLRQDPDVILVGEMRDTETAKTAMDAALTGHMVFSTLHAPSATSAYMRLVEMGVDAFLVSESVSMIISQRLMRRIHSCAQFAHPTPEEQLQLDKWGYANITKVPRPMGCAGCNGTGYRGRIAATEILAPDARVKRAIATGGTAKELADAAWRAGWRPIIHDGIRHVINGVSTVAEVARVLIEEDIEDDEPPAAPDTAPGPRSPAPAGQLAAPLTQSAPTAAK